MSEAAASNVFVAGFAPRQNDSAVRLQRVFAERPEGFAPAALIARIEEAFATTPHSHAPAEPEPAVEEPTIEEVAQPPMTIDPLAQAHQAGYAAGLAAARADQDASVARDLALLEGIAAALKSDDRVDREQVARQLRQTVLHLVTRLVGDAGISADLLADRVKVAADLLADASESAILRVSPADAALLESRLPDTIFAVSDAGVTRGSFILEAASTIVEDGPELWLEQLTSALDKIAVPAAA